MHRAGGESAFKVSVESIELVSAVSVTFDSAVSITLVSATSITSRPASPAETMTWPPQAARAPRPTRQKSQRIVSTSPLIPKAATTRLASSGEVHF